jgi:tetratricopeptide (TPR) repeat protein
LQLGQGGADILAEMGLALHGLEDLDGALACFREALALDPANADVYNNLAVTLNRKHDYEAAASAYESALRLDPGNIGALSNLAMLYEQMNRLEDAEAAVTKGLELAPDNDTFNLVAARCERRRDEPEKAIARLRRAIDSPSEDLRGKRGLHFELGRDYDLMGDFDAAFRHFLEGNRIADEIWPDMSAGGRGYLAALETEIAGSDVDYLGAIAARAAAQGPHKSPAFLLSFPRSGTTLMDTILGAHPDVAVMEEEPPLHQVEQALLQMHGGGPQALMRTRDSDLMELRSLYWAQAARHLGERQHTAKVVVDKNPFYSTRAALIHLLFPDAHFIFAERHPHAVILSCFMQPFGRNPALANFTSLRGSARLYERVMKLWLQSRAHLPLKVHDLRYEALVADKEAKVRETLGFLGLPWDDRLSDHVSHAHKRGRIYTPSYHQVSQPIYTDAVDRWRNYEKYLAEVSGSLQPLVTGFGYDR